METVASRCNNDKTATTNGIGAKDYSGYQLQYEVIVAVTIVYR